MLTVAPRGRVNEVTLLLTLPRCSTDSIVAGRVMADELVLNAVIKAGDMARAQPIGEMLPTNLSTMGNVTQA